MSEKKVTAFLEKNENATKEQLAQASGLKGLPLFNLLKKMQKDGTITEFVNDEGKYYVIIKEQSAANVPKFQQQPTPAKGRDNSKFKFQGNEYGKGPLVRAVIEQYVAENPNTTYKTLKTVFGDDLLKRFGVFQDEKAALEIAPKGGRYFEKPEQLIKLKDRKVMVCNQWTLENIQPFLKVARSLGYKIK